MVVKPCSIQQPVPFWKWMVKYRKLDNLSDHAHTTQCNHRCALQKIDSYPTKENPFYKNSEKKCILSKDRLV